MDLYHETELVSIEDLEPYSNNPKNHPSEQIEKLKKSIKELFQSHNGLILTKITLPTHKRG